MANGQKLVTNYERRHEAMSASMVKQIDSNYDAACERDALEAQEALRKTHRRTLCKLWVARDKGLQRALVALGASAIACLLLCYDGIRLWVAIPVWAISLGIMVWEFIQAVRRAPAIAKSIEKGGKR